MPVDARQFPDELLNFALELSLEWGENWLCPIQKRLRAARPQLSPQDADNLNAWCVEAREFACAEVEKWHDLEIENKAERAMQTVRAKYPQIDDANSAHLFSQGMYYAWHG